MIVSKRKKRTLLLLYLVNTNSIFKKKPRLYWEHPLVKSRNNDGEHLKVDRMYNEFPRKFFEYTRLTPGLFDKLIKLTAPFFTKKDTNFRKCIPHRICLYITLRFLATGDNLRTIATNFSVGKSTVWYIVRDTLQSIWKALSPIYVKAPSNEDWATTVNGFQQKWQFPNCLGAIDGKHVVMEAPPKSGSLYLNYKGTFSIILMATCDAEYRFTTVDVGAYGKQSDGGVFASSVLGKKLNSGSLDIPKARRLPQSTLTLPNFFVGDEAFPLSLYMMRPFSAAGLTLGRRIFNYRLSRARRVIENTFGIMATRFRIFRKPISAGPKHVEAITLAAVALHNFLRTEEMQVPDADRLYCPANYTDCGQELNGAWRREPYPEALLEMPRITQAAQDRLSKRMREDLMKYVLNEGSVEWQGHSVGLYENEQ